MNRLITAVLILTITGFSASGQKKMALFLHGFSSDAQVGWLDSGTPQALQAEGIITGFKVPDLPIFTNIPALTNTLAQQFVGTVAQDKWMVVGHSLGGLIARSMESPQYAALLQQYNVNWRGSITLGTPHQGAPAALNYQNAIPLLDQFELDVLAGPQADIWFGYSIDPLISFAVIASGGAAMQYYEALARALTDGKDKIRGLIEQASGLGADELAPGSTFINSLQSIPANVHHLSIAGVETSPSLIRWAPTIDLLAPSGGINETDAVQKFYSAKNTYDGAYTYHLSWEDFYDAVSYVDPACYFYYCIEEQLRDIHASIKSAYGDGWWQLNGIDDRWFELHNEMLSATGSFTYWVPCEGLGGGARTISEAEAKFREYNPCEYGADGYWVTQPYTYYYAEKSDGYIPLNRTRWFSYQSFAGSTTDVSNLAQANVYFDGAGQIDGYNHSELRNLTRTHGNPTPGDPMQKAKLWMQWWFDH
jgi:pimeloyl-ACP methyl ester carboxylesterase